MENTVEQLVNLTSDIQTMDSVVTVLVTIAFAAVMICLLLRQENGKNKEDKDL
jgi:preprotein translocase subunit YajC